MSEVKLNLTDFQQTIHGTIHGSIADSCVAALSAEPETIGELEAALSRYIKPLNGISRFGWFRMDTEIDDQPWDAGIVIIDLAARIVAAESTYSQPGPNGQVDYHDGNCATDIIVFYRVPDDWLFLNSVEEYRCRRTERVQRRLLTPPLDTRAVLYGRPLLEFISNTVADASAWDFIGENETDVGENENDVNESNTFREALVSGGHIQWLMTPRDDLRGKSPREVLLEKQDFIDYDLHTRSMQWSLLGEGPPCLAMGSFAYRYAGFGTHEWVIYYDLVRHLLYKAFDHGRQTSAGRAPDVIDYPIQPIAKLQFVEQEIARLEEIKRDWLETPQQEYGGRTPAILIQSERRRLPITISGRQLIIDEACPVCQMMAAESELTHEVSFWHLDGSHMDDDFAFSPFLTREEWEADRHEWKAFTEKFNREWEERHRRELSDQTAGEPITDEKDDLPF